VTDDLSAWLASLLAFGLAGAIVLVLRPRLRRPEGSPASTGPVVRRLAAPPLGGISIFLAVVVASLAFVPLDEAYRGILVGTAAIAVVGIVADVRGLPALVMFLAQIGAGVIAVAHGVAVERFTFPFIGIVAELPSWADAPLTIAWIVLLMRLVDFVDGLDGLAAAICGAASLTFVVLSLSLDDRAAAVLSAIVAGACAGFLFRNFYPSRILLGHVGSLVLGYLVATVAVEGLLKTAAIVGVLLPFLVLAVPALDSSFAVATRLFSRVDPRAQRGGATPWSRRRVVLVLSAWCLVVAGSVLASYALEFREGGEWHPWRTALVAALGIVVLAGSVYVIGLIESSRAGRRAVARERPRRIERPAPPGAALSPADAIRTASSSWYGSARRGTDIGLRLLDVAIAGTALVLLSPVLLIVAGVALVTSGRPILYAGSRVGREGDVFTMWKLRTLKPDAEMRVGPFYGAELDRRMAAETTWIGRILRATHLDEAPQLWNVLVGEMSVVGPRPLRPRFFEELCAEIPEYWQRLTVRPGMTGLAQIRIDRGAGWDEKLAHDLEWIADRSVRLYLATVFATAWRVLVATVSLRWRTS
jgi:UDP-GlcNAc:undecaprenyl-phosphate/decaprenyl-phosphate GlcNAc-1-phosphate transferase